MGVGRNFIPTERPKRKFSNKQFRKILADGRNCRNSDLKLFSESRHKFYFMEDILKTFVEVLFSTNTIQSAENLKNSSNDRSAIDEAGVSFRLQKARAGNINLEVFFQDQKGMFFKPIGFYEFDNFGKVSEIYILNELKETFERNKNNLPNSNKAKSLNLIDDVYIALASREVGNTVSAMFNSPNYSEYNHLDFSKRQFQSLVVNELKIDVKTSMMGALEAVYDDENDDFNGEDMLVMFQNNNGITIHSSEREYQNMMNKGLLSIFNAV